MAVKVSFMKPGGLGSINAVGLGACRTCETVTVPGTTTASLQDGEIAVLLSTEAASVVAAHGSTPDAAATNATNATSAGYGVPAGMAVAIAGNVGDKINIKAFV